MKSRNGSKTLEKKQTKKNNTRQMQWLCLAFFFCLPHSAAVTNTFYESRLERTARPFFFRLYHQEKSNTNKFWLPGKLSFCIWYDTPSHLVCPFPLLFISFFPPSPASLPSLSSLFLPIPPILYCGCLGDCFSSVSCSWRAALSSLLSARVW